MHFELKTDRKRTVYASALLDDNITLIVYCDPIVLFKEYSVAQLTRFRAHYWYLCTCYWILIYVLREKYDMGSGKNFRFSFPNSSIMDKVG